MSIAASARVNIPAGPEPPAAARNFAMIASTRNGSSPTVSAPIVDRALQRGGHGAPIKGHPDPFDPIIGVDSKDYDRPGRVRVFWSVRERVLLRQDQDLRADARYLHLLPPEINSAAGREKRGFSVRKSPVLRRKSHIISSLVSILTRRRQRNGRGI